MKRRLDLLGLFTLWILLILITVLLTVFLIPVWVLVWIITGYFLPCTALKWMNTWFPPDKNKIWKNY